MAVYMTAVRIVARSRPPHPPSASPNCQPPICPEMTYATPRPASRTLLQLPMLQVFFPYVLVLDPLRRSPLLLAHPELPSPMSTAAHPTALTDPGYQPHPTACLGPLATMTS